MTKMEQNNSRNALVPDITSILAGIIPIAQLLLVYVPSGLQTIYILQEYFLGVSIVTLILSYMSILAYRSKPYVAFPLPWDRGKMQKYRDWSQKRYEAVQELSALGNYPTASSKAKAEKKIEEIEDHQVKKPFEISSENRVSITMTLLIINVLLFVVIGLIQATGWLAVLQSVNYMLSVTLSVVILVIYRDTTSNNRRYDNESKTAITRAIALAIELNSFSLKPQVNFISVHGGDGLNNLYVRVRYDGNEYEICTDSNAKKMIYCYKLDNAQQST